MHPGELRADFQQFYGLNIDDMGDGYSVLHAADLAAHLPRDGRTYVAENPDNAWTLQNQVLALIEFRLHWWNWAHTDDGMHMRNYPKCLIPSDEQARSASSGDSEQMPVDEMMQFVTNLIGGDDGQ